MGCHEDVSKNTAKQPNENERKLPLHRALKLVVFLLRVKRPPSFGKKNGGMLTYFSRHRLHNFGKEIV